MLFSTGELGIETSGPVSSVHERQLHRKEGSMRNAEAKHEDEVRTEYGLDVLKSGIRGKHHRRYQRCINVALLAADVSTAFPTDKAVDEEVRPLIENRTPA